MGYLLCSLRRRSMAGDHGLGDSIGRPNQFNPIDSSTQTGSLGRESIVLAAFIWQRHWESDLGGRQRLPRSSLMCLEATGVFGSNLFTIPITGERHVPALRGPPVFMY